MKNNPDRTHGIKVDLLLNIREDEGDHRHTKQEKNRYSLHAGEKPYVLVTYWREKLRIGYIQEKPLHNGYILEITRT